MQKELLNNNDSNLNLNHIISNFIQISRSKYSYKFDRKTKLQLYLALAAFITFGIGDSVTGAFMMKFCGITAESNPIARHIMETHGGIGLVAFKLWATMALLTVVFVVQRSSVEPIYWTTNGFLFSFGTGGFLATTSNLMRTFQFDILEFGFPSPLTVICMYLGLIVILILFGSIIDNRTIEE